MAELDASMAWSVLAPLQRPDKIVDLYDACLYEEGIGMVATALRTNTACRILYLGRNSVGKDGAAALANALKAGGNSTLEALYLHDNALTQFPSVLGKCAAAKAGSPCPDKRQHRCHVCKAPHSAKHNGCKVKQKE